MVFPGLKFNHFVSRKFYLEGNFQVAKRKYREKIFFQNSDFVIDLVQWSVSTIANWRLNKSFALGAGVNFIHMSGGNNFIVQSPEFSSFFFRSRNATAINVTTAINYFHRGYNFALKAHIPYKVFSGKSEFQFDTSGINKIFQLEFSFAYLLKWGWLKKLKAKDAL